MKIINSIEKFFFKRDKDYEELYYKYSKLKVENKKLNEKVNREESEIKFHIYEIAAKNFVSFWEIFEKLCKSSYGVDSSKDKKLQKFLLELNVCEKKCVEILKNFAINIYTPKEKEFDKDLHEIDRTVSYSNRTKKNVIINCVKKGIKMQGKIIRKPKVLVTK